MKRSKLLPEAKKKVLVVAPADGFQSHLSFSALCVAAYPLLMPWPWSFLFCLRRGGNAVWKMH